jgi:hypothetical protein
MVQGEGRRVQKKSPASVLKTGDFTRMHPSQSYPRRPFREEYPGRFSDFRIFLLLAPSRPSTSSGQWLLASFVPDYSGGSVPDFPVRMGSRGSLHLDITVSIFPFNKILKTLSSFLDRPENSLSWETLRRYYDMVSGGRERFVYSDFFGPRSLNISSPSPTLIW